MAMSCAKQRRQWCCTYVKAHFGRAASKTARHSVVKTLRGIRGYHRHSSMKLNIPYPMYGGVRRVWMSTKGRKSNERDRASVVSVGSKRLVARHRNWPCSVVFAVNRGMSVHTDGIRKRPVRWGLQLPIRNPRANVPSVFASRNKAGRTSGTGGTQGSESAGQEAT